MSESQEIEVRCPHCPSRNRIVVWQRVDATANPELVPKIADGSLFEFECRGCGRAVPSDYSIDFHDAAGRFFVRYEALGDLGPQRGWTAALRDDESASGYRLLRADNQHAFIELVRILRDGLDEAVMLALKHQLAAQIQRDSSVTPAICGYDSSERGQSIEYVIIVDESAEPEVVTVPWGVYEATGNRIQSQRAGLFPPGEWVDWNHKTAQRLRALPPLQI